jgi:hypothetical protein
MNFNGFKKVKSLNTIYRTMLNSLMNLVKYHKMTMKILIFGQHHCRKMNHDFEAWMTQLPYMGYGRQKKVWHSLGCMRQ